MKHTLHRRPRLRTEAGAVLVIVLLVMLGLLGMGVTALWLTGGNLQVGANTNLRNQALYVAEAGVERAREMLNGPVPPDLDALLAGTHAGTGDEIPITVDPVTGRPVGVGAILIEETQYPPASFNRGAGTAGEPTAQFMGRYTVWIRNDTAECRRGDFTNDTNNAVVIRARGVAPDNRTTVLLEVTMGPGAGGGGGPGGPGVPPPVLCNSGKNACDDNNSVQSGIVVNAP